MPLTLLLAVTALLYLRGWLRLRSASTTIIHLWRLGAFKGGLADLWVAVGSSRRSARRRPALDAYDPARSADGRGSSVDPAPRPGLAVTVRLGPRLVTMIKVLGFTGTSNCRAAQEQGRGRDFWVRHIVVLS